MVYQMVKSSRSAPRSIMATFRYGTPRGEVFTVAGISGLKHRLAADVREMMGEDVLDEVCRKPRWHGSLAVEHEKVACRADRRRG